MALKYKIYQSEFPYHICNRSNNKEYLFDLDFAYPIFIDCLKSVAKGTDFRPHHFILMNNHFHMIGSTPQSNLSQVMRVFQTLVSQVLNKKTGRINHVFGSRYNATVIRTEFHLSYIIRYLYQNPLRANMVKDVFDYPYSSLKNYMCKTWAKQGFHLDPLLESLPKNARVKGLIDICKDDLDDDACDVVRKRLRKKIFETS